MQPQTARVSKAESIDEIGAAVRGILAHHLHRGADDIPLDAKLEGQLEIDSMAMIEINVSLEERFRIAMPDMAVADSVKTVRDLVNYIHHQLSERRP
jgi:acyl carrier protein